MRRIEELKKDPVVKKATKIKKIKIVKIDAEGKTYVIKKSLFGKKHNISKETLVYNIAKKDVFYYIHTPNNRVIAAKASSGDWYLRATTDDKETNNILNMRKGEIKPIPRHLHKEKPVHHKQSLHTAKEFKKIPKIEKIKIVKIDAEGKTYVVKKGLFGKKHNLSKETVVYNIAKRNIFYYIYTPTNRVIAAKANTGDWYLRATTDDKETNNILNMRKGEVKPIPRHIHQEKPVHHKHHLPKLHLAHLPATHISKKALLFSLCFLAGAGAVVGIALGVTQCKKTPANKPVIFNMSSDTDQLYWGTNLGSSFKTKLNIGMELKNVPEELTPTITLNDLVCVNDDQQDKDMLEYLIENDFLNLTGSGTSYSLDFAAYPASTPTYFQENSGDSIELTIAKTITIADVPYDASIDFTINAPTYASWDIETDGTMQQQFNYLSTSAMEIKFGASAVNVDYINPDNMVLSVYANGDFDDPISSTDNFFNFIKIDFTPNYDDPVNSVWNLSFKSDPGVYNFGVNKTYYFDVSVGDERSTNTKDAVDLPSIVVLPTPSVRLSAIANSDPINFNTGTYASFSLEITNQASADAFPVFDFTFSNTINSRLETQLSTKEFNNGITTAKFLVKLKAGTTTDNLKGISSVVNVNVGASFTYTSTTTYTVSAPTPATVVYQPMAGAIIDAVTNTTNNGTYIEYAPAGVRPNKAQVKALFYGCSTIDDSILQWTKLSAPNPNDWHNWTGSAPESPYSFLTLSNESNIHFITVTSNPGTATNDKITEPTNLYLRYLTHAYGSTTYDIPSSEASIKSITINPTYGVTVGNPTNSSIFWDVSGTQAGKTSSISAVRLGGLPAASLSWLINGKDSTQWSSSFNYLLITQDTTTVTGTTTLTIKLANDDTGSSDDIPLVVTPRYLPYGETTNWTSLSTKTVTVINAVTLGLSTFNNSKITYGDTIQTTKATTVVINANYDIINAYTAGSSTNFWQITNTLAGTGTDNSKVLPSFLQWKKTATTGGKEWELSFASDPFDDTNSFVQLWNAKTGADYNAFTVTIVGKYTYTLNGSQIEVTTETRTITIARTFQFGEISVMEDESSMIANATTANPGDDDYVPRSTKLVFSGVSGVIDANEIDFDDSTCSWIPASGSSWRKYIGFDIDPDTLKPGTTNIQDGTVINVYFKDVDIGTDAVSVACDLDVVATVFHNAGNERSINCDAVSVVPNTIINIATRGNDTTETQLYDETSLIASPFNVMPTGIQAAAAFLQASPALVNYSGVDTTTFIVNDSDIKLDTTGTPYWYFTGTIKSLPGSSGSDANVYVGTTVKIKITISAQNLPTIFDAGGVTSRELGSTYLVTPQLSDIRLWLINAGKTTFANSINWSALTVSTTGLTAGNIKLIPADGFYSYFGEITFTFELL